MNAITNVVGQSLEDGARVARLKKAVDEATYGGCIERAVLWSEYYMDEANDGKSTAVQIAEATRHVLANKTVKIYPDELIVGNFTAKRVAGICYPELGGLGIMIGVDKLPTRKVNPLEISEDEQAKLQSYIPFWMDKNMVYLAFDGQEEQMRFVKEQIEALQYQLYEAGGIAHLAPGYEKVIKLGAEGIIAEVEAFEAQTNDPSKLDFYQSVKISMNALAEFGDRYATEARRLAEAEADPQRKLDLERIAEVCARVPRYGATSFYEAVQSMTLTHIAIFQETIGETTCPGRVDQFLNSYYEEDLAAGRISRQEAKDILGAFCVKLCETIPMYSDELTSMLGGLTSWEVVTIGGQDSEGNDATNELSFILLELADELRMRQPNFHVRLHENTPKAFYDEVIRVNFGPGSAPAMYNDETKPTAPGKTLGSTDAGMYNMALALEMALNEGCQFGSDRQIGVKTPPVSSMKSMDDVLDAYKVQVKHQLGKLHADLQKCEQFHAKYHPTPITSATLEGCLEQGVCSTQGGAKYNFSGIQGTGMAVVADSLGAIESAVFEDKWLTLEELVAHLKDNLSDEVVRTRLKGIDKFGNDIPKADAWMKWVGVLQHFPHPLRRADQCHTKWPSCRRDLRLGFCAGKRCRQAWLHRLDQFDEPDRFQEVCQWHQLQYQAGCLQLRL